MLTFQRRYKKKNCSGMRIKSITNGKDNILPALRKGINSGGLDYKKLEPGISLLCGQDYSQPCLL
ncbi:hypothetical protein Ciccas_010541 [Cichlidogyrus casuarinus]|uniref:Uncharacterized protein n=1 Tax=Cichlidogyrus casuarinus TaxID=1844966 RepID=A0ABD2PUN2_9PLAT